MNGMRLLHETEFGRDVTTPEVLPHSPERRARTLRLLHVSTSELGGGAEAVARNLAHIQTAGGHEGWLAVGQQQTTAPRTLKIPNDDVRNVWSRFWLDRANGLRGREGRSRAIWGLRRLLGAIGDPRRGIERLLGYEDFHYPGSYGLVDLIGKRPDLVHLHNLHGGYFDLRAVPELSRSIPVFATLHDNWMLTGHCAYSLDCDRWKTGCGECPDLTLYPALARDGTASNWKRKQAIHRHSRLHVATPSRWLMDMVEQSMLIEGCVDRRVIPNGVDLSQFHPGDPHASRRQLGLPVDAEILLFVAYNARNAAYKDYETLEASVEMIASRIDKPVLFLAVGTEAPPIVRDNAEIRFVPYETRPERIAHFYRAADVYLHATRADNHPLVILEALACGTPVVATSVGGIAEQIRNGETGLLVPARSSEAVASAAVTILTNPALRQSMSRQAAVDARARFDLRSQARSYEEWYLEVLGSGV